MTTYSDVTALIGRTPLVRLNRVVGDVEATVLAKLEFYNPANSVKDRISVAAMIDAAEQSGELKTPAARSSRRPALPASPWPWSARLRGYRVPDHARDDEPGAACRAARLRCRTRAHPGSEGMRGAVAKAEEIGSEEGAVLVRQFENMANPQIHYDTTGPEIWNDTEGKIDILVAGVGAVARSVARGRYLKEQNPDRRDRRRAGRVRCSARAAARTRSRAWARTSSRTPSIAPSSTRW